MKDAFEEAAEAAGVDPATATDLTATAFLYDDNGEIEEELPVTFADYQEAAPDGRARPGGITGSGFPVSQRWWATG